MVLPIYLKISLFLCLPILVPDSRSVDGDLGRGQLGFFLHYLFFVLLQEQHEGVERWVRLSWTCGLLLLCFSGSFSGWALFCGGSREDFSTLSDLFCLKSALFGHINSLFDDLGLSSYPIFLPTLRL